MTLHERLLLLRAIQQGGIPDANHQTILDYPAVRAAVDARAVELYDLIALAGVNLALELKLENALRRRFPGHSIGTYGRLPRWIDELGLMGRDVRFQVERLWHGIACSFAAGASRDAWREQAQRLARQVLHLRWWRSRTNAT
jgi:hypothetical protein